MSYKQAKEFIQAISQSNELREELENRLDSSGANEPEKVRQRLAEIAPSFGAEHGYEFTAEEGFEALENLESRFSESELSDEELENVAGGADKTAQDHKENAVSVFTVVIGCLVSASKGAECTLA